MINKLPRWIESGAFLLALVAGGINAIGLLGFEHRSVSHLSGTATLIGAGLLHNTLPVTGHLLGILVSFFIGAALAGFLLHGTGLKLGRHYDTALMLEAVLIVTALILLKNSQFYGHYAASAACGLQNALVTTYSGAIIRTTHVTGIFTDLGIMLGAFFRGEKLDKRRLLLFLLIVTGFVFGGTIGAFLFEKMHFDALFFPAVTCVILALSYRFYAHKNR